MLYVVAFEECCEYSTGTESIRLQCDQDQDGGRQGVVVPRKMLVEVGDQTAWKVHDAPYRVTNLTLTGQRSGNVGLRSISISFFIVARQSRRIARNRCTSREESGTKDWIAVMSSSTNDAG